MPRAILDITLKNIENDDQIILDSICSSTCVKCTHTIVHFPSENGMTKEYYIQLTWMNGVITHVG